MILIMSLKEQTEADIKKAMLAKNKHELRALRAIKSMILLYTDRFYNTYTIKSTGCWGRGYVYIYIYIYIGGGEWWRVGPSV